MSKKTKKSFSNSHYLVGLFGSNRVRRITSREETNSEAGAAVTGPTQSILTDTAHNGRSNFTRVPGEVNRQLHRLNQIGRRPTAIVPLPEASHEHESQEEEEEGEVEGRDEVEGGVNNWGGVVGLGDEEVELAVKSKNKEKEKVEIDMPNWALAKRVETCETFANPTLAFGVGETKDVGKEEAGKSDAGTGEEASTRNEKSKRPTAATMFDFVDPETPKSPKSQRWGILTEDESGTEILVRQKVGSMDKEEGDKQKSPGFGPTQWQVFSPGKNKWVDMSAPSPSSSAPPFPGLSSSSPSASSSSASFAPRAEFFMESNPDHNLFLQFLQQTAPNKPSESFQNLQKSASESVVPRRLPNLNSSPNPNPNSGKPGFPLHTSASIPEASPSSRSASASSWSPRDFLPPPGTFQNVLRSPNPLLDPIEYHEPISPVRSGGRLFRSVDRMGSQGEEGSGGSGSFQQTSPPHLSIPSRPPPSSFTLEAPRSSSSALSSPSSQTPMELRCPLKGEWVKSRKPLGRGSFGAVYKCRNNETGMYFVAKQVAIHDKTHVEQLNQEMDNLKRIGRHPNIVQYIGTEIDEECVYIFLEFMENGSLQKVLEEFNRPLEEKVIKTYTRQILKGLAHLHAMDMLHRDIKGGNILLDKNGVAKLADFGLSKFLNNDCTMTAGQGTVWWMAPEVINGDDDSEEEDEEEEEEENAGEDDRGGGGGSRRRQGYDAAVDIWSVGCTVIEMANGGLPPWFDLKTGKPFWVKPSAKNWEKDVQASAFFRIGGAKDPPPIPDHLSPTARAFILKCCQLSPRNRPTAQELLEDPFVQEAPSGLQSPLYFNNRLNNGGLPSAPMSLEEAEGQLALRYGPRDSRSAVGSGLSSYTSSQSQSQHNHQLHHNPSSDFSLAPDPSQISEALQRLQLSHNSTISEPESPGSHLVGSGRRAGYQTNGGSHRGSSTEGGMGSVKPWRDRERRKSQEDLFFRDKWDSQAERLPRMFSESIGGQPLEARGIRGRGRQRSEGSDVIPDYALGSHDYPR